MQPILIGAIAGLIVTFSDEFLNKVALKWFVGLAIVSLLITLVLPLTEQTRYYLVSGTFFQVFTMAISNILLGKKNKTVAFILAIIISVVAVLLLYSLVGIIFGI